MVSAIVSSFPCLSHSARHGLLFFCLAIKVQFVYLFEIFPVFLLCVPILTVSMTILLDFITVPTVWYFLFFC